jgi:hypothetical protein
LIFNLIIYLFSPSNHKCRLQEETARVEEHLLAGNFTQAITRCFIDSKANAFENLLEPLQKLLRISQPIALSLAHPELFGRILQKISSNKALTRLNLLRIVQCICDASDEQGALISIYGLYDAIQKLAETDSAILVRDMASKLIRNCDEHEILIRSGGKRRGTGMRRTSSSTTPPSQASSILSMPPTPTSNRSVHSTAYLIERERNRNHNLNINLNHTPYRTTQRERDRERERERERERDRERDESRSSTPTLSSSGSTNTPTTASSAAKSRLPRTAISGRSSRQSMVTASPRKEDSHEHHRASLSGHVSAHANCTTTTPAVMIPNSRRRRQTSGGTDTRAM